MIEFVVGFLAVLAILSALGITRGRGLSQRSWVIAWTGFSLIFASYIIIARIWGSPLLADVAAGGSLGYVTAVSYHTFHHYREGSKTRC